MDTLLMVAVVLIALAVVAQAGVLVAMYMMSRRLTGKINGLIDDSRTLVGPLQTVSLNLKSTSDEVAQIGKIARDQAHRIEATIDDTRETIRCEIEQLKGRVHSTVEEAREKTLRPFRTCAALASAVAEGFRTFRGQPSPAKTEQREFPAA
jgi:hypothetical protein